MSWPAGEPVFGSWLGLLMSFLGGEGGIERYSGSWTLGA